MNKPNSLENSKLLRLSPFICVITGCILIVVGHYASLKSLTITGPVVITAGGLLLVFIIFYSSKTRRDYTEGTSSNSVERCETDTPAERNVNQALSEERSNDHLGPIHHFEVWIHLEFSGEEMVPPSYEEAVSNNNTLNIETLNSVSVIACDEQGFSLNNLPSNPVLADPPSYAKAVR